MGETSAIEWTHSTWNPWRGCTKVDPTCAACYMFRDQRRYGRDPSIVTRCTPGVFRAPLSPKWARVRAEKIDEFGIHLVFTCSWSDWFHEDADEWRQEAWEIIRQSPGSTYQILTSRPDRILDHLPPDWGEGWPNVWMGVTIGNRKFVDRADLLRQVPAVVRFISAEPLLGPLDGLDLTGIDWLIAGGESGGRLGRRLVDEQNEPRPDGARWVRDLRDACLRSYSPCANCESWPGPGDARAGVCRVCGDYEAVVGVHGFMHGRPAFLFKQWGGPLPTSGGRLLDGRTWDELPAPVRRLALTANEGGR